jgi:hypothetical protein
MPPNVSTSATTCLVRSSAPANSGVEVIYIPANDSRVSYTRRFTPGATGR